MKSHNQQACHQLPKSAKHYHREKPQKTEKCHTSTWLNPLQADGFKKQDRQNRLKFFSEVQRNPIYGKGVLIPTCRCGKSNSTLGNTWEADWRPSYLLTDMGAFLSSETNSRAPVNYKSPWQGKLSKHDLKVSSEVRELSQPLHLATILRVNPLVNNLRLHRGVTLKNNPNNIPAMSLYSFFPLERTSGMQALGFPSSQKNQQPHFPEFSFPYPGSGRDVVS